MQNKNKGITLLHYVILTASVEIIDSYDVILTHLSGLAKGYIAVGDGDHGGLAILRKSSSEITNKINTLLENPFSFQWCRQLPN